MMCVWYDASAHVVHSVLVGVLSERWGFSCACFYNWLKDFVLHRLDSLVYHYGDGRKAKLTQKQKKHLCQMIDAGTEAAGFETACWNSILIRVLIKREFGVLYSRY